jgi:cytochrome o ubiquinol oxidase subunit 1
MLFAIGFMVTFVIGGMTGVLMAVPPADFQLHNSLFLVAHFHNVVIGGVLFGAFAGYNYWFPKAFGFRLHDGLGRASFWCWLVGFYLAFGPLYVLGLEGMTRRMQHYDVPAWRPWLLVAALGALVIFAGIVLMAVQLYVSIRDREALRDVNFPALPRVEGEEPYWDIKQKALERMHFSDEPEYEDIEIPRSTPTGFVCAFFATVLGFALIWHIWWMAAAAFVGAFATFVVYAWRDLTEEVVPAEEVARVSRANRAARAAHLEELRVPA